MAKDKFGGEIVEPIRTEQPTTDKFGGTIIEPYTEEAGQVQQPAEPSMLEQGQAVYDQVDALGLSDPMSSITNLSNSMVGEMASGANESFMGFFDLLSKTGNLTAGGYAGVANLLETGDLNSAVATVGKTQPIPQISDVIGSLLAEINVDARPGDPVMAPSTVQRASRAFGNVFGPGVMGMTQVAGRDITRSAGQAGELLGFGSQAPAKTVADIVDTADDLARLQGDDAFRAADDFLPATVTDDVPPVPSTNKKLARDLAVKRGQGDILAADFKLDDMGRAIPDPVGKKAVKMGVDKGAVAMIKAATKQTKQRMADMLDIVEGGKQNLEYRALNRPGKVVGQSLDDRLSVIRSANRAAGKAVDEAANNLKTKYVDVQPAMDDFLAELDNQGIIFDPAVGFESLDFSESSIEGLDQAQAIIKRMVKRLTKTNKGRAPTAFDVHRAKKFIDEQVTYGKTQAGLSGQMAGILKRLRRNLDGILDANFEDYNAANTQYSETIRVLDDIQSLAGPRVDLLGDNVDQALGVMSRKILSNYASGTNMRNVFNSLDDVARQNGGQFDDELIKMVAYEAELRRLFPSVAPANSFQGEIGAETARAAADVATGNKAGLIAKGFDKAAKVFGKTEEDQLKALRDLLE